MIEVLLNQFNDGSLLQADGQIRTGFDVVVAALLGADEFGFSTAPLIVLGCTMMRKCHLNTCPVGIATQDPVLRQKFQGQPEHVINYLFLLAEDVRKQMALLGLTKFQQLIGRTDFLRTRTSSSGQPSKAGLLDLKALLRNALEMRPGVNIIGGSIKQNFDLHKRLDKVLIERATPVLNGTCSSVSFHVDVVNSNRAIGTTLSYHIAKKHGDAGLPVGSIRISMKGSAGQSFCAFLSRGVHVTLEGEANDYVAKGLSGGEVVIYPPKESTFRTEENIIVGNACLYGATSGRVFLRGVAAERFCVRNSGAIAVVEGVGDHGCEYMTGGLAVILGSTGRNFAAGMSGGIAYILDPDGHFPSLCNQEMVQLLALEKEDDVRVVGSLLEEFVKETDSEVAKELLESWPESCVRFVKVFPYEYQKALEQQRKQSNSHPVELNGHHKSQPIKDIEDVVLDKTRGFMKYDREKVLYRPADQRVKDWDEIYNFEHVRRGLRVQASRCMDCGVPFCQSSYGCPLGNVIPKWNDLVHQNKWKEALDMLLQTNNFPEFTGRVCPAPCENACVLAINSPAVTIKNIECAIIDYAFERGWMEPQPPVVRSGKKVAIVGSGPSGLSCAHQLNKVCLFISFYC